MYQVSITIISFAFSSLQNRHGNEIGGLLDKQNAKVVLFNTTAEEHVQNIASIDLITSGNAFYWMDCARTILNIAAWLRENGVLAAHCCINIRECLGVFHSLQTTIARRSSILLIILGY